MARFDLEQWLTNRGFAPSTETRSGAITMWSYPDGLPYLALDWTRDGNEVRIQEYRDVFPPRTAVGACHVYTRAQYEADTGNEDAEMPDITWTEYRFHYPKTRAQAEAIADQMGWNEAPEPPDTPLAEWVAGVDALLKDSPRDYGPVY